MKIFIICSKSFYDKIPSIKSELEEMGHDITLPHSYSHPEWWSEKREMGKEEHAKFKAPFLKRSADVIEKMDAVLCLNFDKHGVENYIGGATFLELYEAFMRDKKIFLWNDIPDGILYDEINSFQPVIIKGDLDLVN